MLSTGPHPTRKHILSIALEDYFQGPAFARLISDKHWHRFETRFEQNCFQVLDRLDQVQSRATFFVNSWVARRRPDLLCEVVRRNHEIALAGARELDFRRVSREELRQQLRRDRDDVEQACGKQLLGFRATGPFLKPRDLWVLDVLGEEGFAYDSSLCPYLRTFAHQPWRQFVHRNGSSSSSVWEVPLSAQCIAGVMVPIAGGNYFRQCPEYLVQAGLKMWEQKYASPLVLYFRLWDLDPDHPKLQTGSLWQHYRHYRNSDRMVHTLTVLFERYRFTSVAEHLQLTPGNAELLRLKQDSVSLPESIKPASRPVSVIIPCFNEETGLAYLANTLAELKQTLSDEFDLQFILVDDGSSDRTWSLLEQHFSKRADTLLLRHERNQGVAAAISTGLSQAHEIACSMDCDCSYDPQELKPMLKLLQDGVDLVTASPYHPEGSVNNVPRWRLQLSRAASGLYRVVTGNKLHTYTACFRVYRRSATAGLSLRNPGFLGVAELLSRLMLRGGKVVEYPTTLNVRIFGQSKMKIARTIAGHLRLLLYLASLRLGRKPSDQLATSDALESQSLNQPNASQVLNYDTQHPCTRTISEDHITV